MDLANFERYSSAGAPALSGATVKLRAATMTNANAGTVVATTTTSSEGYWAFTGVDEGDYDVEVVISASYSRWYKGFVKHATAGFRAPNIWYTWKVTTLGAAAATIDIVQIPTGAKAARVRGIARANAGATTFESVVTQFSTNTTTTPTPDTGANYKYNYLLGNSGAASSTSNATDTSFLTSEAPGSGSVANHWADFEMSLPNLMDTTKFKIVRSDGGANGNNTAATMGVIRVVGLWANTGQIRQVRMALGSGNQLAVGSELAIDLRY